jgi:nucleoside 2-deoxyribosyltransferase
MKPMIVYVAGPYRAQTAWEIECNIHDARNVGAEVAKAGCMPLIPHANTAHFDGLQPDAFWLEGTLELLRRCDAVVLVEGWEKSSGTRAEMAEAHKQNLPVFLCVDDLRGWVRAMVATKQ